MYHEWSGKLKYFGLISLRLKNSCAKREKTKTLFLLEEKKSLNQYAIKLFIKKVSFTEFLSKCSQTKFSCLISTQGCGYYRNLLTMWKSTVQGVSCLDGFFEIDILGISNAATVL